jgi:hypothetical protein
MTDTDNADLAAERDRLQAEVMALRVERDTGVPAGLLGQGKTVEEMRQIAADALAWKGAAPPGIPQQRQTGATTPNYGVGQISREALASNAGVRNHLGRSNSRAWPEKSTSLR